MRRWLSMMQCPVYAARWSEVVHGVYSTVLLKGRRLCAEAFYSQRKTELANSFSFSPIFRPSYPEERMKQSGQRGIKGGNRPPERQNMIERCPVSVFHLILVGSPSGEIPQTHLQSSVRGGLKGKRQKRKEKR